MDNLQTAVTDEPKPEPLTGMAAMEALETKAKELADNPPQAETAVLPELDDYEPQVITMPAGWKMREWRQKHLMEIYEDGPLVKALSGEYPNRWRRNYELVESVLKHDGFDMAPGTVTAEDLLDLDWQDVEEIALAVIAHYQNVIYIKKK